MPPLSDREMEVLREAARGLPNKDIASRLNLSVRTIHTHLGNIFAKLGVGSRTEAVLLALRRGWIALDDTEHPDLTGTVSRGRGCSGGGRGVTASARCACAFCPNGVGCLYPHLYLPRYVVWDNRTDTESDIMRAQRHAADNRGSVFSLLSDTADYLVQTWDYCLF